MNLLAAPARVKLSAPARAAQAGTWARTWHRQIGSARLSRLLWHGTGRFSPSSSTAERQSHLAAERSTGFEPSRTSLRANRRPEMGAGASQHTSGLPLFTAAGAGDVAGVSRLLAAGAPVGWANPSKVRVAATPGARDCAVPRPPRLHAPPCTCCGFRADTERPDSAARRCGSWARRRGSPAAGQRRRPRSRERSKPCLLPESAAVYAA